MSVVSDEPLIGGIQGDRRPCRHLAISQIVVCGSVMSFSSQSLLACLMVARRTELNRRRSGPWVLLTSAATMLHDSFHQANPLFRFVFFLEKNLSQVACVSVSKSSLARVNEGMSVIRGCGKSPKARFQSCSIWSSIIQPVCGIWVGGGGVSGISMNRAAWSDEIDRSKEIEHAAGKDGFPRNGMLTKMWSRVESRPVVLRRVIDPSGTRDMRLLSSSQVSRVGAQGDVGRSGGDHSGECVLKSPHRRRGPSGMGRERRSRKFGLLLMT